MLTSPRLRDYPAGSHALGQESLPEGIVDLVGAGVSQVLSLEPQVDPPLPPELYSVGERCGAAHPVSEVCSQGSTEIRCSQGCYSRRLKGGERRHQGLRHEPASKGTKSTAIIRISTLKQASDLGL